MTRTLRTPEDLAEAGLIAPEAALALRAVAARYSIAVTPAMATLIGQAGAHRPAIPARARGADHRAA
jgi:lysine 2,3-aminomutase